MYAGGISKAAATQLLRQRLGVAERAVSGAIPGPLAPNVRAALESFAYNVGPSAFSTSTLVKLFNAGQRAAAADKLLLRWVHTGGKVSQGLLNRRNAERNLMLYGNPDEPPDPGARPGGPADPSGSRHTFGVGPGCSPLRGPGPGPRMRQTACDLGCGRAHAEDPTRRGPTSSTSGARSGKRGRAQSRDREEGAAERRGAPFLVFRDSAGRQRLHFSMVRRP